MSVLVSGHLRQTKHRVLALQAMVVGLFTGVLALYTAARLARGELLEACRRYAVQLRVLAPVSDYLVGVRAHEVAFQTMEVGSLVLHRAQRRRVRALRSSARYIRSVLLKVAAHQGVQSFVASSVLYEAGFVAERVSAVLTHAVEVRLVLPVAAVGIPAVFVEAEPGISNCFINVSSEPGDFQVIRKPYKPDVSFGHRFILQHSHRVMQPLFLRLRRVAIRWRQGPLIEIEVRRQRG